MGFLFRIDPRPGGGAVILVQSADKPDWEYAFGLKKDAVNGRGRPIGNAGYLLAAPPQVKLYNPFFANGHRLQFRLVANPVKTINDENGRQNAKGEVKKCRVPLVDDEAQRAWLGRKLESAASIESLIVDNKMPLYFRKRKEDRSGKIQPVMFHGILRVQNADSFQEVIRHGIGPAKAFGCGLLSIARA